MKAGIAGAGIMGKMLAFMLLNAGWEVVLFDQDKQRNCSMAAAGLLTPVAELEKNDLIIFQLGMESIKQHWHEVIAQLSNPVYFKQTGSLVLSHPREKVELARFVQIISSKLNNDAYYKKLNRYEVQKLEPEVSKFQEGYYFPDEGQVDNQMLLTELELFLIKKNITWFKDTFVCDIQPRKIILKDCTQTFDLVLDCRGLGAKSSFKDLRGLRGELIWLHAPDVSISRPVRFLHPRYSLYLVPRPDQTYIIGASEIESNDETSISVRTTLELLTAAYYVHPAFCEARVLKTITHCRPTLPHHLPRIKYSDGFIAVNGLYRHGFLIAPALATEVMRWISKGITAIEYPQLWEKYI